jgi:lipoprotein-anchoring transpeptidase ErfK/SrfK
MFAALLGLLATASTACGDPLSFQVLLDRHGFSPGQIDGQIATNGRRALAAFQRASGLTVTGQPDCETWQALTASDDKPTITTYRITEEDANRSFVKTIPRDLVQEAELPALPYSSILELLGERFHAAPALLVRMNRRVQFAPGRTIKVPAVVPFDAGAKRQHEAANVTVEVSRDESSLQIIRSDGSTIFFAPVTSGSEHDPLPIGQWRVTSIDWMPKFHYNPDLFWDADSTDSKATIQPGPNNPVGVVWIGINVEHYGLHGTPEPSAIGHTQSHGCVRLTNWDAVRVASLVGVGTPVVFEDSFTTALNTEASGNGDATANGDPVDELRHKHLRLPIDGTKPEAMKGEFTERRQGGDHGHEAVDILAPRGTPVHAVDNGTIAKLFQSKQGGKTIYQFDETGRFCYYYAHLQRYAEDLREGRPVNAGDVIGYVGTSGNAPPNTPHLHFAVFELTPEWKWWKGRPIDPYLVFNRGPTVPPRRSTSSR